MEASEQTPDGPVEINLVGDFMKIKNRERRLKAKARKKALETPEAASSATAEPAPAGVEMGPL